MQNADDAHYPGRAPVDAYGNGGFRFAEMSHRGSILLLPSGIYGWPVSSIDELSPAVFARVFAEADAIEFLLLGCGNEMRRPAVSVREAFRERKIGLELMTTGAAARTYNVLLAEDRAVAAALIAVDDPTQR
ncbi:Mth938-like domain-containing protein [Rhodoligotrophos ferricapiens]|uniref:Mth938-like domain-containing protein n=1 Tax=Rhodoligotrophos ferricapiens TaxID=3069264 RepID=UPI00315C581C